MIKYNNIIPIMSNEPDAVVNLSVGTLYNTAIQLNFTPPSKTYDIVLYYECYASGVFKNNIYESGDYIIGLSRNTNYDLTIVVVYQHGLKSVVSNSVNSNTNNITYETYTSTTESNAFVTASGISVSADISSTEQLIYHLIDKGLWSKILAGWIFKGTTVNTQKFNIKNPVNTDAGFRLTFFGGGTYSSLGFQTNGINSYANTYLSPSALLDVNNCGMTISVGTDNIPAVTDASELGSQNNSSIVFRMSSRTNSGGPKQSYIGNKTMYLTTADPAIGIFSQNAESSTRHRFYQNTKLLGRALQLQTSTLPSALTYIGTRNPSSAFSSSNQRIQIVLIHSSLTNGQVIQLSEILDQSESIAGRKTW
jgi:hypothetical protein